MSVREDITLRIGNLIGQGVVSANQEWDYAGYIYMHAIKGSPETEFFVFKDGVRLDIDDDDIWEEIIDNFTKLREITRVDGDDYWIRCLAAVKSQTRDFRMLFEFSDKNRWEITPSNVRESFEVLIGDVFPDDVKV